MTIIDVRKVYPASLSGLTKLGLENWSYRARRDMDSQFLEGSEGPSVISALVERERNAVKIAGFSDESIKSKFEYFCCVNCQG